MNSGLRKSSSRHALIGTLFILLCAILASACGRTTDEVPIGSVGLEFHITRNDPDHIDDTQPSHGEIRGNLFTIQDSQKEKLQLSPNERLTISDGDREYNVSYHRFANEFLTLIPDVAQDSTPSYVLRYYRRDGEVLESRIETPEMPVFLTPEPDSEWLAQEQVLRVEWSQSLVPVQKVMLDSDCTVPDENGDPRIHFPAQVSTYLEIDLTEVPRLNDCIDDDTIIRLDQVSVGASFMDSRLLEGSRFELQRHRVRIIHERT